MYIKCKWLSLYFSEPKKTVDGADCVFPFTYNSASKLSCVGNPAWCSLTANYDLDKKSGVCKSM
jgi:hypothetical protein